MTLLLIISILLRVTAVVLSVVLLRRIRDWRMGFLSLMMVFMTYRQGATLLAQPQWWPPTMAGVEVEWSGLAVSVFALLMVGFLGKLLTERKQSEARISESEARYRRAEAGTADGLWEWNIATGEEYCSPRWLEILGYPPGESPKTLAEFVQLIHPDDRARVQAESDQSQRDHRPFAVEMRLRRKDGTYLPVLSRGQFELDAAGKPARMTGAITDITARKQAEAIGACQAKVLEMIATGVPLAETLGTLLLLIEAFAPSMLGSILLLDADGVHVRHGAAPSLPEAFNRAIEGQPIGPRAGSCGTAAFRRKPVIVEDIATDPLWAEYKEVALSHGLRACWSTPIFGAQGEVLGTFAIYYRQPGGPTALDRRCIELATGLAAIAISRQQTEEALGEAESRLRLSVAASNIGLWDWNLVTNKVYYSREWKSQIGYREDEISNDFSEWQSRIHPDDLEPTQQKVRAFLANPQGRHEAEFRFRHKDGSYRWIYTHADVLRDGDGKPTRMLGCHIDVTGRKEAEAALSRQHILLASVLESTNDAIFLKDLAGRYLMANSACRRAMGVPVGEIVGRTDEELVPPEVARLYKETDARVIATGSLLTFEEARQMSDGLHHWLTSKTPLRDTDGRVVGVIGLAHDITTRKQAEEALRESEAKFRTLAETTAASIFVLQGPRFMFANPALVRLTGFTNDELLAMNFWETVHPDHRELVRERGLARQRGEPVPLRYEFKLRTKQGETRWVDFTAGLINYEGQPASLGTALDITERKEAEQALHESRAQLRALLARQQQAREEERIRVSREIHDELGQQLTSLKMDVRWLERKLSAPDLSSGLNPLLERAVAASEMADAMIATVQNIAAELRPGALDQLGLGAALRQEMRRFEERSGVRTLVSVASDTGLPPAMASELFYISREALTNVARHAQATKVELRLRCDAGQLELILADDGVGLQGTGASLGMLGMAERAAQCGGTVAFERNEPHGTRVVVRLPFSSRA